MLSTHYPLAQLPIKFYADHKSKTFTNEQKGAAMYSYALLEPECYYLVQEKENDPLTLLQVKVETETCMYVVKYKDETKMEWKKKTDNIHDILELLSDDDAKKWMKVYFNNEDAYYEEDDD